MEMSRPIAEEIKILEDEITLFDAFPKAEIVVKAPVICFIADNPRAGKVINHRGGSSKNTVKNAWYVTSTNYFTYLIPSLLCVIILPLYRLTKKLIQLKSAPVV